MQNRNAGLAAPTPLNGKALGGRDMESLSKFKREGGRGGLIRVRENGLSGCLDWEMLVGELDMVIYGSSCRWEVPVRQAMSRDEVLRLAKELAAEELIRIEVSFSTGPSVVFSSK